jgi:hypothetical protein
LIWVFIGILRRENNLTILGKMSIVITKMMFEWKILTIKLLEVVLMGQNDPFNKMKENTQW